MKMLKLFHQLLSSVAYAGERTLAYVSFGLFHFAIQTNQ